MKSLYLPIAIKAVKNAEKVIMQHFNTTLEVETKIDQTPVTIADKQAEEIIKDTIRQEFPEHAFHGEESEKTDLTNHRGFTWIIDPIDGTKGYMRGHPLFGTQLALLQDGELVLGVSNAPVLHELAYATKGGGSYVNDKQVHVSDIATLSEAYLSHGRLKYFEEINCMSKLLDISRQVKWARGIGDFWIYHLIAQGKVDIMIEGSVKFWDIAAIKVIVEEAGGVCTEINGRPISPTSTTCIATNGLLHNEVIRSLN